MPINTSVNTSQKERFSTLTDEFIRKIQYKINRRPRKKLNFESPKIVFFRKIANFAVAG